MPEENITIEVTEAEAMSISNILKHQVEGHYSDRLSEKVASQIDGFRE